MSTFRQSLLQAAVQAEAEGKLSREDYIRVWFSSLRPEAMAQSEAFAADHLKATDPATYSANLAADGTVNWPAILAFIQAILPLIMQIITMFVPVAKPTPAPAA
jgi:hypothetical protein